MALKNVAVIGRMRSGTSAFRQFFGAARRSIDLSEVFNSDLTLKTSFWAFLHAKSRLEPHYQAPFLWGEVWNEYLAEQSRKFSADVLFFDLKIAYFPYVLRPHPERSTFFFDTTNTTFIYLRRRNTAAQIISRRLAEVTNVWRNLDGCGNPEALRKYELVHNPSPEPRPTPSLMIEPKEILAEIRAIQASDRAYAPIIEQYAPLTLIYEDTFEPDGRVKKYVVSQVAQATGLDPDEFAAPPLLRRQTNSHYLEAISNRDEFVAAFRGTEFEWMTTG